MRKRHADDLGGGALISMGLCPASRAQWAVVDVGAIAQLVQEVATLQQQLQTAELTLTNAQQQYQAMTGNRGMQNLLSGTNRNYLPTTWSQLVGRGHPDGRRLPGALRRRPKLDGGECGPDAAASGGLIARGASPAAGGATVGGAPAVDLPPGTRQHERPL